MFPSVRHDLRTQWATLRAVCSDRASQVRLGRLIERLTSRDRGAVESAVAELELATLLVRAGFSIALLPESEARSADLRCARGAERLYVEVTAMVGEMRRAPRSSGRAGSRAELDEDLDGYTRLVNRLLARVHQKSRQLTGYAAPVMLAITLPSHDRVTDILDLKELGGALTTLLPSIRHVSAVLLSLWSVEPSPARSAVRLVNVLTVERPHSQRAYPRVRMLVLNPRASFRLQGESLEAMRGLL